MSGYIRRKELKSGQVRYYPTMRIARRERSFGGFKTKRDADARLRRAEAEVAAGTLDREDLDFADFYERWIKAKEKSLKPSTLSDYRLTFRLHILPTFGRVSVGAITPSTVQSWIDSLKLSPAGVNKAFRYFRAALRQAETWELIDKHPCRGIILPRIEREELDYLQPEEIRRLLAQCRETERTLFSILAFSGLRFGEGLALRWKDIDFEGQVIRVERAYSIPNGFGEPKTKASRRAVPMLPSLTAILSEQCNGQGPNDLLFTVNGSTPLDFGNTRRRFYAALSAAGLRHVSVHSLRHGYASAMLASGASVKALQRSLGHASATMTLNVYSHLIPESLEPVLMRADALMTGANGKVLSLERRRI